jgi:hypothetical protein
MLISSKISENVYGIHGKVNLRRLQIILCYKTMLVNSETTRRSKSIPHQFLILNVKEVQKIHVKAHLLPYINQAIL